MRSADLFRFMEERHEVYLQRSAGRVKPWTDDPILQNYRFCNVFRELDTETMWINAHWRTPYTNHPHLWFAMMVARLFNWHETLADIGFPENFDAAYIKHLRRKLEKRIAQGRKVWTGAYMVSTNGRPVDFKHDYVIECVLKPAWARRSQIAPIREDTLRSFFQRLVELEGMGSFMAGQVIADLKYAEGSALYHAEDWWTWAVMGPGSRRGMNRVLKRPYKNSMRESEWYGHLLKLKEDIDDRCAGSQTFMSGDGSPLLLHAQDLQNCLCEFDKYERVRLKQGTPRARYDGGGS